MLYDRPYEDRRKVRVTGPLTVESLSPHRSIAFAGTAPDQEEWDVPAESSGGAFEQ